MPRVQPMGTGEGGRCPLQGWLSGAGRCGLRCCPCGAARGVRAGGSVRAASLAGRARPSRALPLPAVVPQLGCGGRAAAGLGGGAAPPAVARASWRPGLGAGGAARPQGPGRQGELRPAALPGGGRAGSVRSGDPPTPPVPGLHFSLGKRGRAWRGF